MKISKANDWFIGLLKTIFISGREGWSLLYRYIRFRLYQEEFSYTAEITYKCGDHGKPEEQVRKRRCRYCYFVADLMWKIKNIPSFREQMQDRSFDFWFDKFFKNWKKGNPLILVGGDPAERPDILWMAYNLYGNSVIIITAGLKKISKWIHTALFVSINGPEEIHDYMGGGGKLYKTATNNIRGDKRYVIHMVICSLNCAPDVLRFMARLPLELGIRGITFSFYTPQKLPPGKVDPLFPTDEQRKTAVETLHELLKEYPETMFITDKMIDMFITYEHVSSCPLRRGVVKTDDFRGIPKGPCVMGSNADCSKCGCNIPIGTKDIENLNLKALKFSRMFVYKPEKPKTPKPSQNLMILTHT